MTAEQMKQWFRDNIKPYLTAMKSWVTGQIDDAKTELRNEFGVITGTFKGGFTTIADMPSGSGIKTGDWAVLTIDEGTNESGIYVKSASGWDFVSDITTFDEVQAILATDAEFQSGATTQKAVTVKQIADLFSVNVTQAEAQADWDNA